MVYKKSVDTYFFGATSWLDELAKEILLAKDFTYIQITGQEFKGRKELNIFDINNLPNTSVNMSMKNINRRLIKKQLIILGNLLLEKYKSVALRNACTYEAGDYMGWHTNVSKAGKRIYLIWAQEDDKSHFDYIVNGELNTLSDKKGWQVNEFTIPDDGVFPHQVRSETNRICFGFLVS